MDMPVTSEAEFKLFLERLESEARSHLEKNGSHRHIVFLIGPQGQKAIIDFDDLVDGYMRATGSAFDNAKRLTFQAIFSTILIAHARGFVEICEGWGAPVLPDVNTPEKAEAYRQELLKKYGSLANAPGRKEALCINSAYGMSPPRRVIWTIERKPDNSPFLTDRNEAPSPGDVDRLSWLEQALAQVNA